MPTATLTLTWDSARYHGPRRGRRAQVQCRHTYTASLTVDDGRGGSATDTLTDGEGTAGTTDRGDHRAFHHCSHRCGRQSAVEGGVSGGVPPYLYTWQFAGATPCGKRPGPTSESTTEGTYRVVDGERCCKSAKNGYGDGQSSQSLYGCACH
jgi:hypothetical protein